MNILFLCDFRMAPKSDAPKSDAQRQQERRKWLKDDPVEYSKYLKAERERKKENRSKLNILQLKRLQKRTKAAVRKFRSEDKLRNALTDNDDMLNTSENPYKSRQALGKAKRRALDALPKSPRKKRKVIEEIASQVLNIKLPSPPSQDTERPAHNAITDDVKKEVIAFYHDQSYTMPGKADVVTVRTNEGKEKRQKKLLVMTLSEMYENFKSEHPHITIGKSKFAELRPQEVLLSSDTPRNVCGCIYHSNVILLLESLHEHVAALPLYTRDNFVNLAICKEGNHSCYLNECENCKDGKKMSQSCLEIVSDDLLQKKINWSTWSNKAEGFLTKEVHHSSIQEVIGQLVSKTPQFLWHIHIKDKQSTAYANDKMEAQDINSNTILVQMDFAENYSIKYQDEVQSAHWHQRSITVYTVMLYFRNETVSWVIVSDSNQHDKQAVAAFTNDIIRFITTKFPEAKNVHIWTDGPASQYKNRYIFTYLVELKLFFQSMNFKWSFFATAHGKGPNDALGGRAKRHVARKVLTRACLVKNAIDFAQALQDTNIRVTLMTHQDITETCEALGLLELWQKAPQIPGINNTHSVTTDGKLIRCRYHDAAEVHKVVMAVSEAADDNNDAISSPPSAASEVDDHPVSVADDNPACVSDDHPESEAGEDLLSVADDHPAYVADDHPTFMTEDHPASVSVAHDHPVSMSVSNDHPVSVADDHPTSVADDHPTSVADDHPPSVTDDHPAHVADDHLVSLADPVFVADDYPGSEPTDHPASVATFCPPSAGPSKSTKKRSSSRKGKGKKKMKNTPAADEDAPCLICHELFSESTPGEDWLCCVYCQGWAHEVCTAYEGGNFVCDFCA